MRLRTKTPAPRHHPPRLRLPPLLRASPLLLTLLGAGVITGVAAPAGASTTAARVGDAEVAFALGLAAYHRGDSATAAARFAEAVAADPGDGTARYWLGLARLAQGDGSGAVDALTAAQRAERPPRVDAARRRADLDAAGRLAAGEAVSAVAPPDTHRAARAAGLGALPPWDLELRAEIAADSNPALLAENAIYVDPSGKLLDGPQSDTTTHLGARLAFTPLRGAGGWTLALVAQGEQSLHGDLDFLDLRRLSGTASLAWGGDPGGFLNGPLGYLRILPANRRTALLLQVAIDDDALDGDAYDTTTSFAASLFLRPGARGTTRLSGLFRDQSFDRDRTGIYEASGTVVEGELEQTFFFGQRNRFLRLAAAAGQRDAGAAYDASILRGRAELALPLNAAWTLTFFGVYEDRDYDGVESNPLFGLFPVDEARHDTTARGGASLVWAVTPRLLLTSRVATVDRRADTGPVAEQFIDLDYRRTEVALGLRWFFLGGGAR